MQVKIREDVAEIKERLTERLQELEEKLAEISGEKLTDDEVQDPGDQALSSTMESLRSSFQNSEVEEYKRIKRALTQIDEGSYGICVDCSEPISTKRLIMYPTASRCLACQELFEDK
jgi:RNA polymerase-binding protein DksA